MSIVIGEMRFLKDNCPRTINADAIARIAEKSAMPVSFHSVNNNPTETGKVD